MSNGVLELYKKASKEYIGNSNSLHKLGVDSKKLENAATKQILDIFNLEDKEVIYTSGNSESYTLLLNNINGEIITDNKDLYEIGLSMNKDIKLGLENINKNTKLVSLQSNKKIETYNASIHINIEKEENDLNKYDFITIEDDLPFFGVIIKNKNKELMPLVHGGKSTTKYRSGTAPTSLIVSFSKSLKLKYKK